MLCTGDAGVCRCVQLLVGVEYGLHLKQCLLNFPYIFSRFLDCLSPIEVVGHAFHSSAFGDVVLPKLIHFMIPRLTNPYRITIFYHKMQKWKQCN